MKFNWGREIERENDVMKITNSAMIVDEVMILGNKAISYRVLLLGVDAYVFVQCSCRQNYMSNKKSVKRGFIIYRSV